MLTQALYQEGIQYAEQNFLDESANHLKVDKALIREKFDLSGKRVLDFGCGMGGMSLWYAKNWDCEVLGLDIDVYLSMDKLLVANSSYWFALAICYTTTVSADNPYRSRAVGAGVLFTIAIVVLGLGYWVTWILLMQK